MLVAPEGELRVMASSSEAMHLLELFEIQAEEGPCLDCYRTGELVANDDLAALDGGWPRFTPQALEAGFRSAHAVPMRLRGTIIGALNLFGTEPGAMRDADVAAAHAFAGIATIAILQHRASLDAQDLNEQLSRALNSRILIEQAKGMLAERTSLEMDEVFAYLREYARSHNMLLASVAQRIIAGTLTTESLELSSFSD
jgi:GAF domain-containing protein